MLTPCTPEQHVFSGWIIGAVCQCGAQEVRLKPELGIVRAESRVAPAPEVVAAVVAADTLDAELASDAAQAEGEADAEAEAALKPPRRHR